MDNKEDDEARQLREVRELRKLRNACDAYCRAKAVALYAIQQPDDDQDFQECLSLVTSGGER